MRLSPLTARERFTASRIARLATADARGVPHAVPVTFAAPASADVLYFAVDDKPKSTWDLRRLRDIRENPAVSVLVDHYAEDWTTLWWARADGHAEVLPPGLPEVHRALDLLCDRYDQYKESPPRGPVVAVRVTRWSGWASA
ncbi:TIGR03668 family PPOX class F420-dependent oxidoreductase [Streptomyces sp. NPDC006739]|uniref:TIGR03668 family PPOX class F420-dependent oxidoreductase n=1 Tax=Streptomyces sp. NPDC006739 TaxID=3364763 RepID=UPI00369C9187